MSTNPSHTKPDCAGEGAAMQEEQARGGQGDSCGQCPAGPGSSPPKAAASAAIPIVAVKVAPRTDDHDPRSRNPAPFGPQREHERDHERGQGVLPGEDHRLEGFPPVSAAAANGDSAVGGLTSDSTA